MRLIDADLLREHLFVTESRTGGTPEVQAYERGWDDALKSVMVYEPTVYAVEVVRCKDCKWKEGSECVRFADIRPFPDDFCSRAERREE